MTSSRGISTTISCSPDSSTGTAAFIIDEQRHIGWGVWFLHNAAREPTLADRIRATLRQLLPSAAAALAPPDREGADWEALGGSSDEILNYALTGLNRRLNIIGVPLDSL